MNAIEIIKFTKYYKNFKAIDNISFSVKENTITSFVGKNGAGKSTTINCLINNIYPSSGTLKIFNLDCVTDTDKIKNIVSYMASDVNYYNNLNTYDLIAYASKFENSDAKIALSLAKEFELDLKKKFSTLSLGNKKKVAIILTLMKKAKLYIFDEPTNGLDPFMQEKFFEKILKLKENGASIFLSSHNLSEVEKYSDEVIVIKDGKISNIINLHKIDTDRGLIVKYVTADNIETTKHYHGDINTLLNELSKLNLKKLEIKESSLEDEFIKYYKEVE